MSREVISGDVTYLTRRPALPGTHITMNLVNKSIFVELVYEQLDYSFDDVVVEPLDGQHSPNTSTDHAGELPKTLSTLSL
jgi:hypothetical protein